VYKRQIYQIAESNRIESKLFCPNWNALVCGHAAGAAAEQQMQVGDNVAACGIAILFDPK